MQKEEIKQSLGRLNPEIPWTHFFDFGSGICSVDPTNEKFYKKAKGLEIIGNVLLNVAKDQVIGQSIEGKTVLDLACGEGGHSIQFARAGATVLGIDGRSLYVDRAKFAAEELGLSEKTKFQLGDVRLINNSFSEFDVTIFSGILHHLGIEDFESMIASLASVTKDVLLLYTHISNDISIENHRLRGPQKTKSGYEGYLYQEHADGATDEQKEKKVRASIDNTYSFWAREESLMEALKNSGFKFIYKIITPSPFGRVNASYRLMIVAKK